MAATFNSGTYEVYWNKSSNKQTPYEPQSPISQIATSPSNKSSVIQTGAMITMGAVVAKRVFDTIRSEIGASTGNEALQNSINNGMKALGYIGIVALKPIAGGIVVGSEIVLQGVTYNRKLHRENIKSNYDRELLGKYINISSGSAYYG